MPLRLKIEAQDGYNYETEEFFHVGEQEVVLEHCLLAISKWEAKWKKPFIGEKEHTSSEILSYISFMPINDGVDENFVIALSQKQIDEIINYMKDPQTATTIKHNKTPPKSNEGLTSELLYYYMAQVPAPFDICEKWNINRLIKLLEVASIKSNPDNNKMKASEWGSKQAALNMARRAAHKTRG